jgi:hypothetical protein
VGQAFDQDGRVLGEATGSSKKEVFDELMKKHPDAHEIRIRSRELPPHTKLNPGPYDCYARLNDDEPYFVLRAKDPDAPAIVEAWALARSQRPGNESNPKLAEARECAQHMREWRERNIVNGRVPERPSLADA